MSFAGDAQIWAFSRYLDRVRETSDVVIEVPRHRSALLTLWHESMFAVLVASKGVKDVAIYVADQPAILESRRFLEHLGFCVIVGFRDSSMGVRQVRRWLEKPGALLAVTADGPSGPPRVAKAGVIRLARLAGVALHPLHVGLSAGLRRRSWDSAAVPLPHSKIEVRALPEVSPTLPLANATEALNRAMSNSTSPVHTRPWMFHLRSRLWVSACLMPLEWGKARVWPNTR